MPRERIIESYLRVYGTPGVFGDRAIHRRVYTVAGANSLWHHDGQHGMSLDYPRHHSLIIPPGLIQWKIVIHAFVDGKSRLVTAIGCHSNNRALTVLALFERAVAIHSFPSRVWGDHGTENVRVAQ